jgi:cysteine desulfuration protein SufE
VSPDEAELPPKLAAVIAEFTAVGERDRLELLLDFSRDLPPLPPRLAHNRDVLEAVPECQSPIFLATEVADDHTVRLFFDAPAEAPTTRGFAGVLHEGLDGASADEVLSVPNDIAYRLGLTTAVSPLRLNGMTAMTHRIQRQVGEHLRATDLPTSDA